MKTLIIDYIYKSRIGIDWKKRKQVMKLGRDSDRKREESRVKVSIKLREQAYRSKFKGKKKWVQG